ncbi:alpha-1,2-mannosyltransferase [Jatrophihabitans endophyticus]|uniref:Alpha-1,2-mannosyltransferase n=1 Tax=Jatrophihabitans endophyticus TaxID=1206085 RepID=A0A1M5CM34_9ACTN|nr:glycosyltransferase 87 family protein [Jatrophihabitans endophyticus]SHF55771.1 alpha-1,2-mannosyltransferase [Jatrophihabitans endophyticus]
MTTALGTRFRPLVGLLAVSVVGYLVVRAAVHPSMIDFAVYRIEGDAVRHGIGLYGHLATPEGLLATYPPFAAIVFVPVALLPWTLAQVLVNVGNLALLWLVSWQSCRLVGVPRDAVPATAALLAAVAIWAEPVYTTLGNGQLNLALLALVLADFTAAPSSRLRGVGVGLAAGLKVTPIVFVAYLLFTRRYRAAATATATFVATIGVSAAVAPSDTWRYWTHYLYDTSRVGELANSTNQSVQGVLARLTRADELVPGLGLSCLVLAAAGFAVGVLAGRRLGDAQGLTCTAVAGLLGSPIAWTHHWVWCVPLTAFVLVRRPRWWPLVLVFWTFATFYLPHRAEDVLTFPWWELALTNWYALFGIAYVATVVVALRGAGACLPGRRARPRTRALTWSAPRTPSG